MQEHLWICTRSHTDFTKEWVPEYLVGIIENHIMIFTVRRSETSCGHKNQEFGKMNLNISVSLYLCLTNIDYICAKFQEVSAALEEVET